MRLSRPNERKLWQLIWQERLRRFGMLAVVAIVLVGGAVAFNYQRALHVDPTLEIHTVEATVVPGINRANRKGYIFHARMADGHEVAAWTATGVAPPPGTRVLIAEAVHQSGKLSYDLIRAAE